MAHTMREREEREVDNKERGGSARKHEGRQGIKGGRGEIKERAATERKSAKAAKSE